MAGITTRTLHANGLRFQVDEAGVGPDVALCLHGFPESRLSWRHQLEPLAALGWRAVAPDMRGYGDSSRPLGTSAYRLDHLVADIAALFEACEARRCLLIGHDWGALVAWTFAMRRTRPLAGLVTMNGPHPAVFRAVLRRSWYVLFFQLPVLPELALRAGGAHAVGRAFSTMAVDKAAFPPSVLRHYQDNALQPGAATAMLAYYRANARDLNRDAPSPPLTVPTLMIWGEKDTALGVELTEGYGPHVADFTLARLPDASHWVQQDAPDAVNAALARWMGARGLTASEPRLA